MDKLARLTAVCFGVLGIAAAGTASAGTILQSGGALGTTDAAVFTTGSGGGPTGAFQNPVGSNPPFGTTSIVVNRANNTLELKLYTTFTGNYFTNGDTINGVTAKTADIALSINDPTGFNYGIALGKQSLAAGFYQVTSWSTSYQIWNGRSGFDYGGGWALCGGTVTCNGATSAATGSTVLPTPGATNNPNVYYASDTSIASGINLASATVTVLSNYIDVVVPNFIFTGNLSIFWGTADCSNNPIYGVDLGSGGTTGPISPIPEPASLAMLGSGLAALWAARGRRA
jgi:hypothetical protein